MKNLSTECILWNGDELNDPYLAGRKAGNADDVAQSSLQGN